MYYYFICLFSVTIDEYNEEDAILMKAKINFFATKVGEHACVMGFKGAVMDDDKRT